MVEIEDQELKQLIREFQSTIDLRTAREKKQEISERMDELYGKKKREQGGCSNCGYWAFTYRGKTDDGRKKSTCQRCGNVKYKEIGEGEAE